jgi:hypothetical protein
MRCIVCHRVELEPGRQTCPKCPTRVRRALVQIVDLCALVPTEAVAHAGASLPLDPSGIRSNGTTMPGGDVITLAYGGATGSVLPSRSGDRSHAEDEYAGDQPSVLAALASWEDDWRERLEQRPAFTPGRMSLPARPASVSSSALYLRQHCDRMAQHPDHGGHPAFDEFAREIFQLQSRLRSAVRTDDGPEHGAPCPDCGETLMRPNAKPDRCTHDGPHREQGCDQGGRRDDWVCPDRDCGRTLTPREYHLAVWQAWHDLTHEATG